MLSGANETNIYSTKTPYQKIDLTKLDGEDKYAVYLDGAIQFVSGLDDQIYHSVLATLPARMLHGRPGRALILGGGDGLAARNLLRFPNVEEVRMIELDPGMVKFSATHPVMRKLNRDAFRNPRLKVTTGDAREWAAKSPEGGFDIAILDFPDPLDENLGTLFKAPFYQQIAEHLNPETAVWSVQSSSAFSDVEDLVRENLAKVTRTPVYPVRFAGEWMADGTIVYAGRGVDRAHAQVPSQYRSTEGIYLSGSIF
jgi:spermidine synthase